MKKKNSSLQILAILLVIIVSFAASGLHFSTLNTKAIKKAAEAEADTAGCLLAEYLASEYTEEEILAEELDQDRLKAVFSSIDRIGEDIDAYIISEDGTIHYKNGEKAEGDLLRDVTKGKVAFSQIRRAVDRKACGIWFGESSVVVLKQEYLSVHEIYKPQCILVVHSHCTSEKAMQQQQFSSLHTSTCVFIALVGAAVFFLIRSYKKLLIQMATIDELTELSNRKSFTSTFEEYVTENTDDDLSLFLLDIDYFKQINDNYGHAAGDQALHHLAKEIAGMVKGRQGFAGRWGGDEFIGVMPIPGEEALLELKMLCRRIENKKMPDGYNFTISAGIYHSKHERSLVALSEHADEALYLSKENGRNQATLHKEAVQKH